MYEIVSHDFVHATRSLTWRRHCEIQAHHLLRLAPSLRRVSSHVHFWGWLKAPGTAMASPSSPSPSSPPSSSSLSSTTSTGFPLPRVSPLPIRSLSVEKKVSSQPATDFTQGDRQLMYVGKGRLTMRPVVFNSHDSSSFFPQVPSFLLPQEFVCNSWAMVVSITLLL